MNGAPGSIASAPIDPAAEPAPAQGSSISGQQESTFFETSKKKHELDLLRHNLGYLGKFWGSSGSATINIAGFLLILLFIFVAVTTFAVASPELSESRKWAFGLATTAVGYLFGAASKKD